MSEKMLVTQALDERDLLVKKIADKIAKAMRKLSCRHRNVLKSTRKVKSLSRLAGGKPRGCNVGIYIR